jgi:hypothetical protein
MAKETKIKGNEKIFNKILELSDNVKQLSSIVQNDAVITEKEMLEWLNKSDYLQSDFRRIHNAVFSYIVRGNKNASDVL